MCEISLEANVATDKGNGRNDMNTEQKDEIGVAVQSWLWVSASWTHGLIAQLVTASEQNSVVVGLNPTQANFL